MSDMEHGARQARDLLLGLYAKHKAEPLTDADGVMVKGWRAVAIFLGEGTGAFWRMAGKKIRPMSPDQVNLVLVKCGYDPVAPDPAEEIKRLGIKRVVETINRSFPNSSPNTALTVFVPVGEVVGKVHVKTAKTPVPEIPLSSVTSGYVAATPGLVGSRSFLSLVGSQTPPEPKTEKQRRALQRIRSALSGGQDMCPSCFSVEEWSELTRGPDNPEPELDRETAARYAATREAADLVTVDQLRTQAREYGKLRRKTQLKVIPI